MDEKIIKDFLISVVEHTSPIESLLHIFNFINDKMNINRILYVCHNRKDKSMNIMIDYSPDMYIYEKYDIPIKYIIPDRDMALLENKINCDIYVENNIKNKKHRKMLQSFPFDIRSVLSFTTDIAEDKTSYTGFEIYSDDVNAFKLEDVELLRELKDIVCLALARFTESNIQERVNLSSGGILAESPEHLLRSCPGMRKVMRFIDNVADTDSNVLIWGPTGSGKELVADTICSLSSRSHAPCIKVNCGAIPETLVDAAFFGAEKGAYTGAVASIPGYFEQAHGGTLYLDEIGELSLQAQVRLLRVLEGKEVRRVGGVRRIPVDVRVIAATHRNLWEMVDAGTFREDLCYRLHVIPLQVPSLAERKEDIPVLARYFYAQYIKKFNFPHPPRMTPAFLEELCRRSWPGNVRQLRYAVERALVLNRHERELCLVDDVMPRRRVHERMTYRERIEDALAQCGGRIDGPRGAAALLGMRPSTLRDHMKAEDIPLPRQRRRLQKGKRGENGNLL